MSETRFDASEGKLSTDGNASAGPSTDSAASYRAAGVDTTAGDVAVQLMREAVTRTHGPEVFGGVGGFAGLWDASALRSYRRPLLASSTDGVGTKVAIAQAVDRHDTIGQDLVGMVVDDIVVMGARPLFMTDYIACGRVVPEKIATIVAGIARACAATGTALVGGETAEHPGLLEPDEYDVAGAAVGAVEADTVLGPERVADGDVVLALPSSGLHSNGFSLVRHILKQAGVSYTDHSTELGRPWGEVLLEPTRLYTAPILRVLEEATTGSAVHALSHITGGGIAANVARVLPRGSWVEVERSTWTPPPVFHALSALAGSSLESSEGTWNLGVGFVVIVAPDAVAGVTERLTREGIASWPVGAVSFAPLPTGSRESFEQGAKGVDGGAVRLTGSYRL